MSVWSDLARFFRAFAGGSHRRRQPLVPSPPAIIMPEPTAVVTPPVAPVLTSPRPRVPGIEHGICYRHGRELWTWGAPGLFLTSWASCSRTWKSLFWGVWLTQNGLDWLERPVRDLPAPSALTFAPDILLKHLCSYTSLLKPPGSRWTYSNGPHWPLQSKILGELYGTTVAKAFTAQVLATVGVGSTLRASMNTGDGTLRVFGSCRDQARLSLLMLTNDGSLVDPTYVSRMSAGGPNGDGRPYHLEGYQTHLIRNGKCHARPAMPTVPDGFMARDGSDDSVGHGHGAIVTIPSIGLSFAYRGASLEEVLPAVCEAVMS